MENYVQLPLPLFDIEESGSATSQPSNGSLDRQTTSLYDPTRSPGDGRGEMDEMPEWEVDGP